MRAGLGIDQCSNQHHQIKQSEFLQRIPERQKELGLSSKQIDSIADLNREMLGLLGDLQLSQQAQTAEEAMNMEQKLNP